jgi:hypothetical protein
MAATITTSQPTINNEESTGNSSSLSGNGATSNVNDLSSSDVYRTVMAGDVTRPYKATLFKMIQTPRIQKVAVDVYGK